MNKPMSAPDGFYTVKIGNITSVRNPDSFDNIATFAVYPNPISSNATVEITTNQAMKTSIDVIDNLGNIIVSIFNGTIEKGTQFIPIQANNLATGMYYIRIVSNEKRSIIPISILK
jgi:hypothetical protein